MARTSTPGIQKLEDGYKVDKIYRGERIQQRGFESLADATDWLNKKLGRIVESRIPGGRIARTFDEAAAHYLKKCEGKKSLVTDVYHITPVMPFIGHLTLDQIHNGALDSFKNSRKATMRRMKIGNGKYEMRPIKNKTVNHSLAIVRRILKLAADDWRDVNGMTWLQTAPMITLLPLTDSRPPRPIQWDEQRKLLLELPVHLEKMALFIINTGVRDDVVCNLRWEWAIDVQEIGGNSVFVIPKEYVKGPDHVTTEMVVVCNDTAQEVINSMRGKHDTHVFVWRRERAPGSKAKGDPMKYRPIGGGMSNTAWEAARERAQLGDLHVHDLRHTTGMRLREVNASERTIDDVLWHKDGSMSAHYSIAQILEMFDALQSITTESGRKNVSLRTLIHERNQRRVTQNESGEKN